MTESPFATPGYNPDVRKNAEDRADVPRDRYNRYLVKLPGMEHMPSTPSVPLTRVSTITKALIQKKSLIDWRERVILEAVAGEIDGPTASPLLDALSAAKTRGDRKEVMRVGEELFKRGGGKAKSQLGTAMHEYTEKRNRGEDPGSIPEEHRPSLAAYDAVLDGRVRVLPEFLERRLIAPWSAGGTLDNIVMYRNDLVQPEGADESDPAEGEWDMRVADLKTGRDISKGWAEKVIQLWEYANAEWLWDEEQGIWVRPPRELRKDRGLIIHVPMDGTATLYDVDLSGVDRVVEAAMIARRHEAEAPTRARVVATADQRGPAYVAPEPVAIGESVQVGESIQVGELTFTKISENPFPLGGDGKPLQPLAKDLGKRGCGVCGRVGHKRGSATCLGENDPGHMPDATSQIPDINAPLPSDFAEHAPDATSQMPNGAPVPTCPGHGAGWTNRGDGVFVCAQCGLPSPKVATTLTEAVQTGQFPLAPDPELSVPAATVPDGWSDWVAEDLRQARSVRAVVGIRHLAGQKESWKEEVHGVLARDAVTRSMGRDIDASESAGEVLIIRDTAIQFGAWVPEQHDTHARSRWETLMREGKK